MKGIEALFGMMAPVAIAQAAIRQRGGTVSVASCGRNVLWTPRGDILTDNPAPAHERFTLLPSVMPLAVVSVNV